MVLLLLPRCQKVATVHCSQYQPNTNCRACTEITTNWRKLETRCFRLYLPHHPW